MISNTTKKIIFAGGIILIILIFVAGPGTPGGRALKGTPIEWLSDILVLIFYTFTIPFGMPFLFIPLILMFLYFLYPIIWALKPVNDYKKPSMLRRTIYPLTGIMLVTFLGSSWLLYEILTCTGDCMTGIFVPFATIGFLSSIFTISMLIIKSRKALKEIKEESLVK